MATERIPGVAFPVTDSHIGAHWFTDFHKARDWAAKNVKGFPAWRVGHSQGWPVVELIPGTVWVAHMENFNTEVANGEQGH